MSMKERTPCNDDEKEASSGDERSVNMDALLRSEMSEVIESDAGIGCDGIGGRGGGGMYCDNNKNELTWRGRRRSR